MEKCQLMTLLGSKKIMLDFLLVNIVRQAVIILLGISYILGISYVIRQLLNKYEN